MAGEKIWIAARAFPLIRFPATIPSTVDRIKTDIFVRIMIGIYSFSFFHVSVPLRGNSVSMLCDTVLSLF
jgi:hypothetical protein